MTDRRLSTVTFDRKRVAELNLASRQLSDAQSDAHITKIDVAMYVCMYVCIDIMLTEVVFEFHYYFFYYTLVAYNSSCFLI